VTVVGAVALSGSVWSVLLDLDVDTIEAYTLPLAVIGLVTGLWVRRPDWPSWLTVGPGVVIGLVPSAVLSLVDEDAVRPLLTVIAAAAVLAFGVQLRWQALVVTGSAAIVAVAVGQLGPYAVGAPRWVTLGATGLVLLTLGMRYEQRRNDARRAAHWLAHLD
jgi:hypothetical protein